MDKLPFTYNNLPSEEELQHLANTFFKAPPSEEPLNAYQHHTITSQNQSQAIESGFQADEDILLPTSHVHLPSTAGIGLSPTGLQQEYAPGIEMFASYVPFAGGFEFGKVPGSQSGKGISPIQINQENVYNIQDSLTSIPKPQLTEGKIPNSLPGIGISPSILKGASQTPLRNPTEHETSLGKILKEITSFRSIPQVSGQEASSLTEPSFYFLNAFNPFDTGKKNIAPNLNASSTGHVTAPFDINLIKQDFPILQEKVNGKQIVWLDNAATTQKPKSVIDRLTYFYSHENSNIHRAAHELAARATDAYEGARKKVQRFINAASDNEIIFVRGTTEAINLVAASWGDQYLQAGDEIIVSHLEHHANIVPWQLLAKKKGLIIKVIPVDDDGQIILSEYARLLNDKTKLVSFTQVSNALGTITPAIQMVQMAHRAGAKVLVDGAQSVSHMRTDIQLLDADFFVFSGHKLYGPTGIGVLYGKEAILNSMQPYQGGGNMIKDVTFEHTEFHQSPARFEAGTGNIADAVGLGEAIDYISRIGIELIALYEHALLQYGITRLKTVPGIRLIGTAHEKASVMSFVLDGYTNDEVGQALNKEGIAVRTGHHCAQPILRRFGVESTVRPSLAFYNTCSDIDRLVDTLFKLTILQKKNKVN